MFDLSTEPAPQVDALMIADGDDFVGRRTDALALALDGLDGDRHQGATRRADARTPWHPRGTRIANTRQVSLVSVEECDEIAAFLGLSAIDPGLLGPNLVLRGIPTLSLVPPATRLQFPSGATLFVTEQNIPCRHPGARIAAAHGDPGLAVAFGRAASGRRGVVALVERPGTVRCGDPVRTIPVRSVRPHLPRVVA